MTAQFTCFCSKAGLSTDATHTSPQPRFSPPPNGVSLHSTWRRERPPPPNSSATVADVQSVAAPPSSSPLASSIWDVRSGSQDTRSKCGTSDFHYDTRTYVEDRCAGRTDTVQNCFGSRRRSEESCSFRTINVES